MFNKNLNYNNIIGETDFEKLYPQLKTFINRSKLEFKTNIKNAGIFPDIMEKTDSVNNKT